MSEILKNSTSLEAKNNNPEPTRNAVEYFKGRLCSLLVPGDFLLGTKLGEWYETNEYHKFNVGDYLVLKSENIVGYGVRPVGLVRDYIFEEKLGKQVGRYVIEMVYDGHVKGMMDRMPREVQTQKHFKSNIEMHFRKVIANNHEDALNFYR